jgi:hypothetical protein
MRGLARIALATLLAAAAVPASVARGDDVAAQRSFEAANRAFAEATDSNDYLRVAAAFQALRDEGAVCGAVLYDLGNAFYRAGETGRAIAAWLEAQRYLPRDPRLAANLSLARRDAGVSAPPPPLLDRILFWQGWLSWPEKRQAALAACVLAFLLAAGARFGLRMLRLPARALLIVAALLLASFAIEWRRIEGSRRCVVVAKEVTARKGDALSYAPAFTAPLREGQEAIVTQRRPGWLRIELSGGLDGWVPESDVAVF